MVILCNLERYIYILGKEGEERKSNIMRSSGIDHHLAVDNNAKYSFNCNSLGNLVNYIALINVNCT